MLHLGLIAHTFTILTATVQAGEFLSPWTAGITKDYSNNIDYAVGVRVITEWAADFNNARIQLNQDSRPGDVGGGAYVVLEESYNEMTWDWKVSYEGIDPTYNNVFFFIVAQADGTESFTGHYFNISNASTTTTSSSSATAAPSTATNTVLSTVSSTAVPSLSKTPQSTSPATITLEPSSDRSIPVGTIAGMVVGIIIGFMLLVGGAWWAWKVTKRRQASSRAQPPNAVSGQPYSYGEQPYSYGKLKPYEFDGNQAYELHESVGRPIQEMHGSVVGPIHELHESVRQPRN